MTMRNDAREEVAAVDSDRVDGGSVWRTVLAALVAGLVVGAALGAAAAGLSAKTYQASTALSVLPDPTLSTSSQSDSSTVTQDATAFIQSELVVLNGSDVSTSVRKRLGLSAKPDVVSTQVGQSYVVRVTATAATQKRAVAIARETATVYAAERSSQLTKEITSLQGSVTQQLNTVQKSLTQARRGQSASSALTPSQTALQTQYEQLLSERSDLSNTQANISSVVRVLTPAQASSSGLSTMAKYALGGALVGALIALALLVLVRRSRPRIRSVSDLATLNVPMLLPVQPAPSLRAVRSGRAWRLPAARLLAARLQSEIKTAGSLLIVVGTDGASGARAVASGLAAQLVGRRPVLLISEGIDVRAAAEQAAEPVLGEDDPDTAASLADELAMSHLFGEDGYSTPVYNGQSPGSVDPVTPDGRPAGRNDPHDGAVDVIPRVIPSAAPGVWLLPLDAASFTDPDERSEPRLGGRYGDLPDVIYAAVTSGWLVVLDAPPLSESGLAIDCAENGGLLALVVGRNRSTPAGVLGAVDLCDARRMPLSGAVLTDAPGAVGRWVQRVLARATPLPAPASDGDSLVLTSAPWSPDDRDLAESASHHRSLRSYRNGVGSVPVGSPVSK